ncbi:FGD6-like protein [Mya arenaria]|uniref:FGD6-like protein n=1 Tax=Mya arenaria TaxID=6604 RepID=A0ABY7FSF7_MYAAR|nr:FGD6-like protein [Mya arenaria]
MIAHSSNRPRPPPPSKKPKPSLPLKPSLPAKPALELKNGDDSPSCTTEHSAADPTPSSSVDTAPVPTPSYSGSTPPDTSQSTPQGTPDPSTLDSRATLTRPKGPPPPLPKTASSALPKTPPKPLPKTPTRPPPKPTIFKQHPPDNRSPVSLTESESVVRRTPPSLPMTPPRASVRKTVTTQGSAESDNSLNVNNSADTENERNEHENNSSVGRETYQSDNDRNTNAGSSVNCMMSKLANSQENLSQSSGPKVPMKPKPRSMLNKSRETSKKENSSNDISVSSGKSTFFAKPDEKIKVAETSMEKISKSENAIKIVHSLENPSNHSVKYKKMASPAHSPLSQRKPPPKPPAKPAKSAEHTDEPGDNSWIRHRTDNESDVHSSNEQLNKKTETESSVEEIKHTIIESGDSSSVQCDTKTGIKETCIKTKVSPTPLRKPHPPKPVARPRPTPRKSLNRQSLDEERLGAQTGDNLTSSKTGAVCDNVFKEKMTENGVKNDGDVKDVTEVRKDVPESDTVGRESPVKLDDDQYRKIEKRVNRSPKSHITELEGENHSPVILRKKISRDTGFDIQDVPSVEELKSLFYDSDEETQAPGGGENQCLSKDFQFGDKFLKFASDDSPNKTKTSPTIAQQHSSSDKDSFEDILGDKELLEPSSLLNEIEDILTRSYKHSSLTRSGSSPEKKSSPFLIAGERFRSERSNSVDVGEDSPIRPPRPKKEGKRLRSLNQMAYDSCGSDTESLPDMSRPRRDSESSNISMTLGKARPHPPKPKRHKLLRVQRSQSDITAMKSVVEKSPQTRRQQSNESNDLCATNTPPGKSIEPNRPASWRKNRPSRKAPPPPPGLPFKVTPPSPTMNLDTVVPVDERVKSMHLSRHSKHEDTHKRLVDSTGSFYHSIPDEEGDSSEGEHHDYQDIPDQKDIDTHLQPSIANAAMSRPAPKTRKQTSPPKLPPRNLNNSHSFDTSSLSSAGHDFDSAITGGASSNEDMSISSSCFDGDIKSPANKKHQLLKVYPKTSSPFGKEKYQTGSDENVLSSGLGPSMSSLSDCGDERNLRPISDCSIQSDILSGSHGTTESSSSSDSELDEDERAMRKKEKKLFMIAKEIASSERVFVDVLRLLNVDFRKHISKATEDQGRPVIPSDTLNRILDYLPQLQNFNEELLADLEDRIEHWEEKHCIADIFKKKGPFLKLFSSYILNFENLTATLDDALKKYPAFQAAVKEFEMGPHYMKHLPADSPEIKDMTTALAIVSDVAFHANENMRHEDYVQKMLEIQKSLVGHFEIIKPGRFSDVLLYTTEAPTGYRLNNTLSLTGMKVSVAARDEYKMEFSIISTQRSFTLQASSLEERDDWVSAINSAIEENTLKRDTFVTMRSQALIDKDFVLGHKAPLWIPDARVTMCMICTVEFTVTFRRHHCRACGWVVCAGCSENKIALRYLKYKMARVCDRCSKALSSANDEGACMSGYLQKWHKGRKWKKQWYLIKDKDTAAADSMVLLGYEVTRFNEFFEGVEAGLLLQLSHKGTTPLVGECDEGGCSTMTTPATPGDQWDQESSHHSTSVGRTSLHWQYLHDIGCKNCHNLLN